MQDRIVRATAANGGIRLVAVLTTESSLEAKKRHGLSYLTTCILGRAFSASLLLASSMKIMHGRVTLRVRSDGPLKGLLVDAGRDGKVRGYVGNPNLELDLVKIDNNKYSFDFTKALGTYLYHSEQTPSAVFIGEKIQNKSVICSGGLLAQVLPKKDTDPLLVSLLEERCKEINSFSEDLFKSKDNLLELIRNIFPDIDDKSISEKARSQEVSFKCKCSKQRSLNAMKMLDKSELEDILKKDGKAELVCEFCKNKYLINYEEIKSMIENQS